MASLPKLPPVARKTPVPANSNRKSPPLPAWLLDMEGQEEPEPKQGGRQRTRYRTVWISDIHLGTPGCSAELLLDFLKSIECETLYLVGDIIDAWQLKRGWYWPARHNDVVRRILKMAKRGTHVVYIPGNHDEMLRDYAGLNFGDVEIALEWVHETADGRRLLVLHGDVFDSVVMYARWLAFLGDHAYTLLLKANTVVNVIRRRFDMPYWSLAAHLKKKVKNAVAFISRFEEAVAHAAADRHVDGVVCGHIHFAEIRQFGDITYYNDGDWVESCTALVEHADGAIEVIDWAALTFARTARSVVDTAEATPRELEPA